MTLGGGKFVKSAMQFTLLLMKFEVAIIAPFLLFNFIKNPIMDGMKSFAVVLIASTIIMMVGAIFMTLKNGLYASKVMHFAFLLDAFMIAVIAPMLLFNTTKKFALDGAKDYGLFIALCSFSLIIGAFFIVNYGYKPILQFGELLMTFVIISTGAMIWFSNKSKFIIDDVVEFGLFVLLCSSALVIGSLFIHKYGAGSVLKFGVLLVGFIGLMTLAIVGINKMFKLAGGEVKIITQIAALGTFILSASAALVLGAMFVEKYGVDSVLIYAGTLILFIGLMSTVMSLLGFLSPLLIPGEIAATLLGISLLTLTGAFFVLDLFFKNDKDGERTKKNIGIVGSILNKLWGIYALLGLLSPFIALGSAASVLMSISLTLLGGALALVNLMIDPIKDTINDNIMTMMGAIGLIGLMSAELILMVIPLTLSLPALALMTLFCLGITANTLLIATSIKKMDEIGDLSDKIDGIVNNIQLFVDIPDKVSFGGIIGMLKKITKIGIITLMVMPLALAMKTLAVAVSDLANLKVATRWDKNGNPISFRQLNNKDFDIASDNIGKILSTMADAMINTYEGADGKRGLHEFFDKGLRGGHALWMTLYFGKKVGEVISGVAEGVGNMAKMQIPIAWNNEGKPIAFRQLKDKDFDLAAEGTQKILTSMVGTIIGIYKAGNNYSEFTNGKNIFDAIEGGFLSSDKPSPFQNTLEATLKIGELISNISEGVGKMAKMQIPTAWDNKGKAIAFRTLKPKDFSDASDNIEIVLTSIIGCLADLYKNGKEFDPDKKQNIFDVVSGGLLGSDDPPPIIAVIEASTKVSELIANIGKGIKDMSTMMIPNAWNDKGQPTHYVKLTKEDFTGAANSVADIITCLIKALSSESTMGVLKSMNLKNTLEAMLPASELISGIADGIIKLASGQVPSKWDPKTGKPIEYKKITIEDYIAAGVVITEIMTYMVRTLQDVVYGTNNGQSSLISIFKDDTFKDIVDSISTIGGLISDIADSVIKMGQGLIPNKWDKDGKVIGYTPINFDTATKNLKSVVSEILMVTVDSLIEAYNGKDGKTGIKDIIGDSDNSPFMIAVQGITQIMQTVSSITDSVVKLGQAQIPIIWDKNGKPIWWKEINVSETIKNIEKIFNGDGTTSGIFSILCKSILDVHKEYFKEGNENNLTEVIPNVTNGIEQIVKTVSNTADLLVKIGSLALPTGFDKDGKPKNMHIVNDKDITKAKENITNILTSLLSIFDKDIKDNQLNKYLNG